MFKASSGEVQAGQIMLEYKNANGGRIREQKFFFRPPQRGGKVKVNCLAVTVKIMFKWYNNAVATNVAD